VVLVNGQPSNGINEISDLPTEAVSRVQLLPRQAAGQLGQNPTRRVVNIVIKPDLRQVTANGTAGLATAGKGFSAEGELSLLSLAGGNRRSLVLKAKHADPLYEGDRDILGDGSILPFDLVGNIVPYPTGAAEIDPALSALAGRPVSVAGVPAGNTAPTLAAFAARAGDANVSDLGRYRTLLPRQRSYSANANLTQQLWANATLSLDDQRYLAPFRGARPVDQCGIFAHHRHRRLLRVAAGQCLGAGGVPRSLPARCRRSADLTCAKGTGLASTPILR
jgi:iron complex outermembrane receptor protein